MTFRQRKNTKTWKKLDRKLYSQLQTERDMLGTQFLMKKKYYDIGFIGAGNLAWHLAPALENAGHHVRCVFSRNETHAKALCKRLYNPSLLSAPDFSDYDLDIIIISTADDAVNFVSRHMRAQQHTLICHCAGNVNMSELMPQGPNPIGVLYPLQTFSKEKTPDFQDIPFCIEADNKTSINVLKTIAQSLSEQTVKLMNSRQRRALHVAAVFACNFTNHMLNLAHDICKENDVDYEALHPLIAETINKSMSLGPQSAQTGPARRGDFESLDKHMEFLESEQEKQEIYRTLTEDILKRYGHD